MCESFGKEWLSAQFGGIPEADLALKGFKVSSAGSVATL